jgi:hypothetical protein
MYVDELLDDLKSKFALTDRSKLKSGTVSVIDEFPFFQQEDGRIFYYNSREISHEDVGELVAGYPGADLAVLISRRAYRPAGYYHSVIFCQDLIKIIS